MSPRKYIPTGKPRGRPKKISAIQSPAGAALDSSEIRQTIAAKPSTENENLGEPIRRGEESVTTALLPTSTPAQRQPSVAKPTRKEEQPGISEEELNGALIQQGEHLEKLLEGVLPEVESRERTRIAVFLQGQVEGKAFLDMAGVTGVDLLRINQLCTHYPAFRPIYHAARDAGEEYRKGIRAIAAHKRAVDGWENPSKYGSVRYFDSRLLQFLMEADDPAKYRPKAASVNVNNQMGVQVIFENPRQEPQQSATDALHAEVVEDNPQ